MLMIGFLLMFTKIMEIYECSLSWCLFRSSVKDLLIWKMSVREYWRIFVFVSFCALLLKTRVFASTLHHKFYQIFRLWRTIANKDNWPAPRETEYNWHSLWKNFIILKTSFLWEFDLVEFERTGGIS